MPFPSICLARAGTGSGGITGGGGVAGPMTNVLGSTSVSGYGLPVINIVSDSQQTFELTLYDNLCGETPSNLSDYSKIEFVAKEYYGAVKDYIRKPVTIVDAAAGKVQLTLTPSDLPYSGLWLAGLVCYQLIGGPPGVETQVAQFPCYLNITRSLNSKLLDKNTPLTIPEVRLALRDVCPNFNTLLEDVEFSDTEIAFAITRPVDEWNETPPDVRIYSYATFEFRTAWLKATIGYLLQTAAFHYSRNRLPYSAGGLTIDDKNKAGEYSALANSLLAEWRNFMMAKKREINMASCYGIVGSRSFR